MTSTNQVIAGQMGRTNNNNTSRMPSVRHPDEYGLNSQLEQATLFIREASRPDNTAKAMDPKIEEYFEYCEKVWANDPYSRILDDTKV